MPSHATENWLRTQLRLREKRIEELKRALAMALDAAGYTVEPGGEEDWRTPGWVTEARAQLVKP